jgi:hypothetical protein
MRYLDILNALQVGGICRQGVSLYGSSVRGAWRGGLLVGDPRGYERKALGTGTSLYGGSGDGVSLSVGAL